MPLTLSARIYQRASAARNAPEGHCGGWHKASVVRARAEEYCMEHRNLLPHAVH